MQVVTGRSERYGRKLISQIKKKFEKESHQLVSVEEFCSYTGLEKASVLQLIKY